MRTIGISLVALALHCLGSTGAGAQLRGLGGGVPGVGGAVSGLGGGAAGLGGSLGGAASGFGGSGLGGSGLGGSGSLPSPSLTFPFPGQSTPSDAVGAADSAQGTVSNLARPAPLNTVTNSLAGSVTGAASRTTNTLLGPTGNPIGQLGAASRQAQGADPRNRSGVPPAGERRYVAREVVIGLASDLSPRALDDLARRHRLAPVEAQQIALIGTTYHRWRIGDGRSVSEVIRALEADGAVRTAQPNYRFMLAQSLPAAGRGPTDPSLSDPSLSDPSLSYASGKLHLAEAHRLATGKRVLVAVIDSGIDTSHPELADAVAASYDAVAPAGPPNLHGTGMAGAIVARSQMTGSAPGARLLAIRAFGGDEEKSEATTVSLLKSIDWAVAHGARVINMSFAGPYDPDISRGIAAARQKGVVLVAAAGNAGPKSPPLYPAADKNVIAVTATNAKDQLLPQANRGRHIAVAAPGVDVIVPSPGQGYQLSTGTSVAAAEVSGIVALLIELQPGLTPDAIRKILQSTALDLGPKGIDEQFGAGLADAQRAVLSLGVGEARVATVNEVRAAPVGLFAERWPEMPLMPFPMGR
jgi:hypothetical protein